MRESEVITLTYMRVTLGGPLPSGEVWSVNPVFEVLWASTPTPAQMQAVAVAIAAVVPGTNLRSALSSSSGLTKVRVEARDNAYNLLGVGEATPASAISGTGTASKPLQASVVLSLRTDYPGASKRGRLYWPALGVGLQSDTLRIPAATCAGIASHAAVYLDAIADAIQSVFTGVDVWLSVYSTVLGSSEPITSIWVGDILDVQRRRRDSAAESYSIADFPVP